NDYVFVHCATVEMWKTLTKICGRPELGDDPRYADRRDRVKFIDEIDAMIGAWTEKHTKQEAMNILAGAGVPCGAALDSNEGRTVTLTERFLPSVCSTVASASSRSPTTTGARNFAVAFAGTTVGSSTASIAA